jgi:hypothetical protein
MLTFSFQVYKFPICPFSIAVISSRAYQFLISLSQLIWQQEILNGHMLFCVVNPTILDVFSYLSHEVNVDFDAALIAIKRKKYK